MARTPYHTIEPVYYVDADTGAVLSTVSMRVFYGWDYWDPHRKPQFTRLRWYPLDREAVVNPKFGQT